MSNTSITTLIIINQHWKRFILAKGHYNSIYQLFQFLDTWLPRLRLVVLHILVRIMEFNHGGLWSRRDDQQNRSMFICRRVTSSVSTPNKNTICALWWQWDLCSQGNWDWAVTWGKTGHMVKVIHSLRIYVHYILSHWCMIQWVADHGERHTIHSTP